MALSFVFCLWSVLFFVLFFFFFKQKTAYEMRISDWSSDVCSSDLRTAHRGGGINRRVHNRLDHIHPLDDMAERGIAQIVAGRGGIGIEARPLIAHHDRELAARRARLEPRDRERAAHMMHPGLAGGLMPDRRQEIGRAHV